MLYCLAKRQRVNLAYYVAHMICGVKNRKNKRLPYGMLLTRIYRHIKLTIPKLLGDGYLGYNRVMEPLGVQKGGKTSTHSFRSSSKPNPTSLDDEEQEDVGEGSSQP